MSNTTKAKGKTKRGAGTASKATAAGELDLDALAGQAAEFPFWLGGRRYVLCDLNDIDIEVIEAADTGNVAAIKAAIRYGLGDAPDADLERLDREVDPAARAEWTAFISNRITIRIANKLFTDWLAASGLAQGE